MPEPASTPARVPFRRSLQLKVLVGVLLGVAMMLSAVLLVFYAQGYQLLRERESALASSAAQRLASEMGQQLALAEGVAASLANLGELLPKDAALWQALIPNLIDLEQHGDLIAGGGIWPEPGAFAPGVARRSFFWGRNADGRLAYYDDYNRADGPGYHQEEWYVPARYQRPGQCYWSRSYQDPYTGEPMVTCSVPMWHAAQFTGVSTVDLRLSGLQQFLANRGSALHGYAFAIDRNGVFITIPQGFGRETGHSLRPSAALALGGMASELPEFAELADFLRPQPALADTPALSERAQALDAASPAIDASEALRIARQLADAGSSAAVVRQGTLATDAFLHEPVLVTALQFPGNHWQLAVVQPARLVHEAVMAVIVRVTLALALAILVVIVGAGWMVRQYLVAPIRTMAHQLALAEPAAGVQLDARREDELGLLARVFNTYANQLASSHEQLLASARQFKSVTELQHDALIQMDDDGLIRTLNRSGEQMFGWREAEVCGQYFHRLLPWDPRNEALETPSEGAYGNRVASRILHLSARRRDGSEFPADVSVSYWRGPDGGLYNIQISDETERRQAEAQVRQLATHDTLTGLPNRALFNDRLQQATLQCVRNEGLLALLFLDLDHFKLANDSLGHTVGDALLKAVAQRLQGCVDAGDTVARLGGDEFAILLPEPGEPAAAAALAARVIEVIGLPFDLDGQRVHVGVSVGVTLCPNDDVDAEQLLRKADLAMYHAKAEGRNTYRFFTERLHVELLERKALLDDLARALNQREFVLHYQPVMNLRLGRVDAIEALLRWQHPTLGLVGPDRFIPLAESSGMIVALGSWVIERAIHDLAELDRSAGEPLRLAINLSLVQFRDADLVHTVQRALAAAALPAARIEFELTESVLMDDRDRGIHTLTRLRELGVGLVIDDFGTGYSSLAHLRQFPVQKLKIDKSFVRGVATDAGAAAICRSVVGLGHNLGLQVVAEGVESAADLGCIRELQCEYAQGFYYSHALPLAELQRWLAQARAS